MKAETLTETQERGNKDKLLITAAICSHLSYQTIKLCKVTTKKPAEIWVINYAMNEQKPQ